MSEPTILEMLREEEGKIAALELQLATKGLFVKPYRTDQNKNILEQLHCGREKVKFLMQMVENPPTSLKPPESSAVAVPPPAAPAQTEMLSDDEKSRLLWNEELRYAQGKLSAEDARTLLSEREKAKKLKGPTLTEQCLAITGGKNQIHP